MDRLATATSVYTQVLAEQPPPLPQSGALPAPSWASAVPPWLRGLVRPVSTHEPAPAPDRAEVARLRAEWEARYQAAARDLVDADQERRGLIDAFVAPPTEAVDEMMRRAAAYGRTPLHPLLQPPDLAAADRLYKALVERPGVLESLDRIAAGQAPGREERERLSRLIHETVVGAPRALPKSFPAVALDAPGRAVARQLVDRLVEQRPRIREAIDAVRAFQAAAPSDADRARVREVGAQVVYAEAVPKEALIEARKVASRYSPVLDVALTESGFKRRMPVGGAPDLLKSEPIAKVPEPTVARWRQTLQQARADVALAEVGMLAVTHSTPTERMVIDREVLGRRVGKAAEVIARSQPPAQRTALEKVAELPRLQAEADALAVAAAEVKTVPGIDAAIVKRLDQAVAARAQAVAPAAREAASWALREPALRQELSGWKGARDGALARQMTLAKDAPARTEELTLTAAAQGGYLRALQGRALPMYPGPSAVSDELRILSGGSPAGEVKTEVGPLEVKTEVGPLTVGSGSRELGGTRQLPGGAGPLREPGERALGPTPGVGPLREPGERAIGPTPGGPLRESGERALGPSPGVAGPLREPGERAIGPTPGAGPEPGKAVGDVQPPGARMGGGPGVVPQPSGFGFGGLRPTGTGPRPGTGAFVIGGVTTMEELTRRLEARLEASMRAAEQATQQRIAQAKREGKTVSFYGAVYRRDQLNDPNFLQAMFVARMGGWGYTHRFSTPQEFKKFLESRLNNYGAVGMVHLRSDLNDPAYMQKLFQSRVGGFGWTHTFKNENEYRNFIQSRLGGYGRVSGCEDLLRLGWKPEQVKAIFDNAQKYGKKPFESQEAYEKRMLAEHPDEFVLDDGHFRRKTPQEKQAEERKRKLASGKFIEDPATGNLVARDSKRGREIVAADTTTVQFKLADGSMVAVTVEGNRSLQDAIIDELRGRGYSRDIGGNWRDAAGRIILDGSKALEYDQRYIAEKSKTNPDFARTVTYRLNPLTIPPPPTPEEQLAALQADLKKGIGYEIRGVQVGGKTLDVQVKPGQSPSEALLEELQKRGVRAGFAYNGAIIDPETGKIIVPAKETGRLDQEYDKKLTDAVFGEGNAGFIKEVQWLAQNGTPAQKARAQEIIQQMTQNLGELKQTVKRQADLQAQLDALGDRDTLNAAQRAQYDRIAKQLEAATRDRQDLESSIIDGSRAANDSAKRAVDHGLTYNEREALKANAAGNQLADEIKEIDRRLAEGGLGPTERRNLEARRARRVEDLVRAERKQEEYYAELQKDRRTAAVDALAKPVDKAGIRVAETTVLNRGEAVAQARDIVYDPEDAGVAYAADELGRRLLDPSGKPIRLSRPEQERVTNRLKQEAAAEAKARQEAENRLVSSLVLQRELKERAAARIADTAEKLGNYQRTLDGIPDTPQNRERREQIKAAMRALVQERQRDIAQVDDFARKYGSLDDTRKKEIDDRADALRKKREAAYQEYLEGKRSVTYMDKNGKMVEWQSERQLAYQKAQQEKKEAEDAKAQAERAAKGAAAARAEAQAREAARKRALEEERKRREADKLEAGIQGENRRVQAEVDSGRIQQAEAKRRQAEADLREAEKLPKTAENDARLQKARDALKRAQQEEFASRVQATGTGAGADVAQALNAQAKAVEERRAAAASVEETARKAYEHYQKVSALAARGQASEAERAAAEAVWVASEAAKLGARQDVADAERAYGQLADSAQYVQATPELNAARLAEFQKRKDANRAAGRTTYEGFTEEERREESRRSTLDEYHKEVAAAAARADALRDLALAREAGKPLAPEDEQKLARGLSARDAAVLRGERERRERLEKLSQETDLEARARGLASLQEWLSSAEGARSGRPLSEPERQLEAKLGRTVSPTDRVPRTPGEWDIHTFEKQDAERARRQEEINRQFAEKVLPALEKNRAVDRELEEHRARVASREQRVVTLKEDIDKDERAIAELRGQIGRLQQLPDVGAALSPQQRARQIADRNRQIAETEERIRQRKELLLSNSPEERNRELRRIMADIEIADEVTRDQMLEKVRKARPELVETEPAGGWTLEKAKEKLREAKISPDEFKAREERRGKLVAELTKVNALPNLAQKELEAEAAIQAKRPPEWTFDQAARQIEEERRVRRALEVTAERTQLEEVRKGALQAAQEKVRQAEDALAQKRKALKDAGYDADAYLIGRPPASDRAALQQLQQSIQDAKQGLRQIEGTYERRVADAEKRQDEVFAANRRDRVGPTDTFDLKKGVTALGEDYERALRADEERKQRTAAGAVRQIEIAQRDQASVDKTPSLLVETVKNIEAPSVGQVLRAAAMAEVGAAKFAADSLVAAGEMVKGGAELLIERGTAGAYYELGEKVLAGVEGAKAVKNNGVVNTLQTAFDKGLKDYERRVGRADGTYDLDKIAQDAGYVGAAVVTTVEGLAQLPRLPGQIVEAAGALPALPAKLGQATQALIRAGDSPRALAALAGKGLYGATAVAGGIVGVDVPGTVRQVKAGYELLEETKALAAVAAKKLTAPSAVAGAAGDVLAAGAPRPGAPPTVAPARPPLAAAAPDAPRGPPAVATAPKPREPIRPFDVPEGRPAPAPERAPAVAAAEPPRPTTPRPEAEPPRTPLARPETPKPPRTAAPRPETPEPPRAAAPRPETPEPPRTAAPRPQPTEPPRTAAPPRPEAPEPPRTAAPRPDTPEAPRTAAPRPDTPEPPRTAAPRPEAPAAAPPGQVARGPEPAPAARPAPSGAPRSGDVIQGQVAPEPALPRGGERATATLPPRTEAPAAAQRPGTRTSDTTAPAGGSATTDTTAQPGPSRAMGSATPGEGAGGVRGGSGSGPRGPAEGPPPTGGGTPGDGSPGSGAGGPGQPSGETRTLAAGAVPGETIRVPQPARPASPDLPAAPRVETPEPPRAATPRLESPELPRTPTARPPSSDPPLVATPRPAPPEPPRVAARPPQPVEPTPPPRRPGATDQPARPGDLVPRDPVFYGRSADGSGVDPRYHQNAIAAAEHFEGWLRARGGRPPTAEQLADVSRDMQRIIREGPRGGNAYEPSSHPLGKTRKDLGAEGYKGTLEPRPNAARYVDEVIRDFPELAIRKNIGESGTRLRIDGVPEAQQPINVAGGIHGYPPPDALDTYFRRGAQLLGEIQAEPPGSPKALEKIAEYYHLMINGQPFMQTNQSLLMTQVNYLLRAKGVHPGMSQAYLDFFAYELEFPEFLKVFKLHVEGRLPQPSRYGITNLLAADAPSLPRAAAAGGPPPRSPPPPAGGLGSPDPPGTPTPRLGTPDLPGTPTPPLESPGFRATPPLDSPELPRTPTPRLESPDLPRTPTPRPVEPLAKPTIEPPRRAAEPGVGEPVGPRRPDVDVPPRGPGAADPAPRAAPPGGQAADIAKAETLPVPAPEPRPGARPVEPRAAEPAPPQPAPPDPARVARAQESTLLPEPAPAIGKPAPGAEPALPGPEPPKAAPPAARPGAPGARPPEAGPAPGQMAAVPRAPPEPPKRLSDLATDFAGFRKNADDAFDAGANLKAANKRLEDLTEEVERLTREINKMVGQERIDLAAGKTQRAEFTRRVREKRQAILSDTNKQIDIANATIKDETAKLEQAQKGVAEFAASMPGKKVVLKGPDGKDTVYTLTKRIGETGAFNLNFTLEENPDILVKFGYSGIGKAEDIDAVLGSKRGVDYLLNPPVKPKSGRELIRHPKLIQVDADADVPYQIVEKVRLKENVTDLQTVAVGENYQVDPSKRRLFQDERQAIAELYGDFIDQGLVWADGKLDNLYFYRGPDGRIRAAPLDTDRIGPAGAALRGKRPSELKVLEPGFRDVAERWSAFFTDPRYYSKNRVESIKATLAAAPEGYRPTLRRDLMRQMRENPRIFMRNMLEQHGYIRYNAKTKQFEDGILTLEEVNRVFKDIVPAKKPAAGKPTSWRWTRPGERRLAQAGVEWPVPSAAWVYPGARPALQAA